jgi:hypothetical protein
MVEGGVMIKGIGRVADNEKAIILYFDRKLTDGEMRALHDHLREADETQQRRTKQ